MGKGEETRQRILQEALRLVGMVGFEGLTLGPLAEHLGLSKSGLFAHFGSREDLQLATLEMAAEQFRHHVIEPALKERRGLPRLLALLEHWFARHRETGCVFLGGSAEYDDRPGPMRDAIARLHQEWRQSLARAIRQCQEMGQLHTDFAAEELAFDLFCLSAGFHHDLRLYGGEQSLPQLRKSLARLLRSYGGEVSEGALPL